ncbi:hypothetical protein DASC09_010530 [Saccharomycopsis crataegensis]|uniref:Glutamyl-tRNA(Gln) amidotransferase subunit A, mitochondrial n=1 Tax=Saccharomycopsis crataegensis TaxID=43959 RepID=A0AAV5QG53_9ASCO|nr:hypothetical protein DASC09_010530 [Saccharomycopsis crataegensis]
MSEDAILAKVDRIHHAQKKYNIFISTRPVNDLRNQILSNIDDDRPLTGTLCAIKDNIVTKNEATTCASAILKDYQASFNATVVELLENNGSVIIGKANLDEFGMGANNTHSFTGQTLNPMYDDEKSSETLLDKHKYVPGGSSGGSAAAVSAELCDFALGSDTGGSVRLPAAYCGVYGFKPSYGRISRYGVLPYADSLDTVGILARSLRVTRKVYDVLNQSDVKDPSSICDEVRSKISKTVTRLARVEDTEKITIGISKDYLAKGVTPDILVTLELIASKLFESGYTIVPVDIPSLPISIPAYFATAYSEAASNLSRYEGVERGYSNIATDGSEDYKSFISKNKLQGFGNEVQKRLLIGNYNLSSEKFRDNSRKAQAIRDRLRNEFNSIFKMPNALTVTDFENAEIDAMSVDFIIAPISTTKAPKLEDLNNKRNVDPISAYVNDAFLIPSSLTGLPSISVPWHSSGSEYPTGLQIIGQYGDDQRVLDFAEKVGELNTF